MGEKNSSFTRVVPVFERLFDRDPSGGTWLPGLTRMGSFAGESGMLGDIGLLIPDHQKYWGENERRLAPPLSLLEWLIDNITIGVVQASGDAGKVLENRMALARKDPNALETALEGLRSGNLTKQWYVLEGPSSPDAFLETERILLVVEGKRTERGCTTKTKFMSRRSQLLRHMDAAFEIAGGRRVLGLLIVEGDQTNPYEPSDYWKKQSEEQISDSMLRDSLPHRNADERAAIAGGVLGATTWQRICRDHQIDWPPVTLGHGERKFR